MLLSDGSGNGKANTTPLYNACIASSLKGRGQLLDIFGLNSNTEIIDMNLRLRGISLYRNNRFTAIFK